MNTTTASAKTYTSASNAKRAAKAAGIKPEDIVITPVEISGSHGPEVQFAFSSKAAAKPTKAAKKADPTTKGEEANITDSAAAAAHKAPTKKAAKVAKVEVAKPATEDTVAIEILRKSTKKNPVQVSWDMFDNLRAKAIEKGNTLRRKDAIAYAVKHGIAFYTARTQYQSWKTANKF